MLHRQLGHFSLGRANPLVPLIVVGCGAVAAIVGPHAIGLGLAVGAVMALLNGALLSHRVDMAAGMNDVGHALLAMQLGLLITCGIIAVATILLIHFSIAAAIGAAAGFAVAQLGSLATFYWTRGREHTGLEGEGA